MTQNGTYWLSEVSEGQIEEGISTKGRINFSTEQFATSFFFLVNFQQLACSSAINRILSLIRPEAFRFLIQPLRLSINCKDYVHCYLKDYNSHEFGCRGYYPFNQYKLLI